MSTVVHRNVQIGTFMEYKKNPFKINEGKIKEVFKENKGAPFEMADVKTGEVSYFQRVTKVTKVIVDTANYTKIYKGNKEVVRNLTHGALLMLHYIIDEIDIHSDQIVLESNSYCSEMKCADKTFRRSINELLEKNIIAHKYGSTIEFFVNINYVFNGSRLKVR